MNILLTGCAGFIGYHTARRLLDAGHTVTGVDSLNDYYDPQLKRVRLRMLGIDIEGGMPIDPAGGFTFIEADICDPELYAGRLAGLRFDAVCHLAAQAGVRYSREEPMAYAATNLDGFARILEYCRHNGKPRLVFASSSSVYGANSSVPYCEDARTDTPVSFYGATKKSNEVMAYSYASLYGLRVVGLRFFTVYGPWGRPDMAPFIFTGAILEGRPIKVFNNGDMKRDFTYIDDIAEGVCRVLFAGPQGWSPEPGAPDYRIYNIGNSHPVKLEDFISEVERLAGRKAEKKYLPMEPGDVYATWADTTRLRTEYAYAPSTPLTVGLARFVEWYREYYNI